MVNASFDLELYDVNDLKDIKLGVLYVNDFDIISDLKKLFSITCDFPIVVLPMMETALNFMDIEEIKKL